MNGNDTGGVRPWTIIRIALGLGIAALRIASRGGCDDSSSSRYSGGYNDYGSMPSLPAYDYASGLAGLGVSDTYERLELPGMSLKVPPGPHTVTGDDKQGSAKPAGDEGWAVMWALGTMISDDEIASSGQRIAQHTAGAVGVTPEVSAPAAIETGSGASAGKQITISTDGQPVMTVTWAECNGRLVELLYGGATAVTETTELMTASFDCPRPVVTPPTLATMPGWMENAPYFSNAHDVWVTTVGSAGSLEAKQYEALLASAAPDFKPATKKPKRQHGRLVWLGTIEGDTPTPAAVVAWQCADLKIGVATVSAPVKKYLAEGLAFARTARCE